MKGKNGLNKRKRDENKDDKSIEILSQSYPYPLNRKSWKGREMLGIALESEIYEV